MNIILTNKTSGEHLTIYDSIVPGLFDTYFVVTYDKDRSILPLEYIVSNFYVPEDSKIGVWLINNPYLLI